MYIGISVLSVCLFNKCKHTFTILDHQAQYGKELLNNARLWLKETNHCTLL